MSKYKIFRIDHYDPSLIGKRRRRLNLLFPLVSVIFVGVYFLLRDLFKLNFGTAYIILVVTLGPISAFFHFKLKRENKKFIEIGHIEFTSNCIIKRIGDSFTEISYGSIDFIELGKHIPATSINESKSGYMSYILKIKFRNTHMEHFMVSDKPISSTMNICITETLKTLQKISHIKIKFS